MKILFAIQGTGNGHISRAREVVPLLQQHGEVDLLVSGIKYQDVTVGANYFYFVFRMFDFGFVFPVLTYT